MTSRRILSWVTVLILSGAALATSVGAQETECIDHGTITFAGLELGAAQCGEKVIFSDATEMQVPNGYVLIRLGNSFYFYSPTLDKLLDVNVLERVAIGQELP